VTYDEWVRLGFTLDDWLKIGTANGYCDEPTCDIHDSVMTEDDADAYFDGADNCIWVTRLHGTDQVAVTE